MPLHTLQLDQDGLSVGSGQLYTSGNNVFVGNNLTIGGTPFGQYAIAFKNRLINGAVQIWQKGLAFADTTTWTADRWFVNRATGIAGITVSKAVIEDAWIKVQRNFGNSSTLGFDIRQPVEYINCFDMAGDNATFSFRCFTSPQYNGAPYTLTAYVYYSTVIDPNVTATTWIVAGLTTFNPTTIDTTYSFSAAIPANAKNVMVRLTNTYTSSAAAGDDSIYFTNFQLEKTNLASSFDYRPYSLEYMLCQRYVPAFRCSGSGTTEPIGTGQGTSTTSASIGVSFLIPARVIPTGASVSAATRFGMLAPAGTGVNLTGLTFSSASLTGAILAGSTAASLVAGNIGLFYFGTTCTSADFLYFTGCEMGT